MFNIRWICNPIMLMDRYYNDIRFFPRKNIPPYLWKSVLQLRSADESVEKWMKNSVSWEYAKVINEKWIFQLKAQCKQLFCIGIIGERSTFLIFSFNGLMVIEWSGIILPNGGAFKWILRLFLWLRIKLDNTHFM